MIVREIDDGLLLINQADHARLAGVFTKHWGNDRFARPAPFESMCIATARHDDGWIPWDASPKLDAETGRPINFPHIAVDEHIALYMRGIDEVISDDAYAGLMVNRHCQWLYDLKRRGSRTRPLWSSATADEPRGLLEAATNTLQRQHDDLMRRLCATGTSPDLLSDDHLQANSLLIQFYDALSLYFCTAPLRDDSLNDVPIAYSGETASIALRPLDAHTVVLDPWPFASQSLDIAVDARRLSFMSLTSDGALQDAHRAAPTIRLSFTLRPI